MAFKKTITWFNFNILIPFVLPPIFLMVFSFFHKIPSEYNGLSLIDTLINNGVYIFFGVSYVVSCFQFYKKRGDGVFSLLDIIIAGSLILFTLFLFICSLKITPDFKDFEDNYRLNIGTLFGGVFYSTYIQFKVYSLEKIQ